MFWNQYFTGCLRGKLNSILWGKNEVTYATAKYIAWSWCNAQFEDYKYDGNVMKYPDSWLWILKEKQITTTQHYIIQYIWSTWSKKTGDWFNSYYCLFKTPKCYHFATSSWTDSQCLKPDMGKPGQPWTQSENNCANNRNTRPQTTLKCKPQIPPAASSAWVTWCTFHSAARCPASQ